MCDAPTKNPFSSFTRPACPDCGRRTRLVDGGVSLFDILRSTPARPHQLEGNGLNAVLNPVEIDGRRGWANFYAGSFIVLEEVRPSADYFDFAMQHFDMGLIILAEVRKAELRRDSTPREFIQVLLAVSKHPPHPTGGDALSWLPWVSLSAQAAVAKHRPILTNEQAWLAAEARMKLDHEHTPDDDRAMFERLARLAEGRQA